MNSYYFYDGPNQEYETIMRNNLKLMPSLKTKATVIDKIEKMSRRSDYCRNEIGTGYLTQELMRPSIRQYINIIFYIEDKQQQIIGVIVFHVVNRRINVEAFCTPFSGGHGRRLMKYVIEFGKLTNMEIIRLSAAYSAVGFYQKMGLILMPGSAKAYAKLVTKFSVFSPRARLTLLDSIDSDYYEMRFDYSTDYKKTLKTRSLGRTQSRRSPHYGRSTRNVRSI